MANAKIADMMSAFQGDSAAILGMGSAGAVKKKDASAVDTSFVTVMNQTAEGQGQPQTPDLKAKTDRKETFQEINAAKQNMSGRDRTIAQADQSIEQKIEQFCAEEKELTDGFEQEMKQLLTEQLDISEEELEAAMATLGIGYVELLNPVNLSELTVELTGVEDACTLLMDENFTEIMQQTDVLAQELTQAVGLTKEQLLIAHDMGKSQPQEWNPVQLDTLPEETHISEVLPEAVSDHETEAVVGEELQTVVFPEEQQRTATVEQPGRRESIRRIPEENRTNEMDEPERMPADEKPVTTESVQRPVELVKNDDTQAAEQQLKSEKTETPNLEPTKSVKEETTGDTRQAHIAETPARNVEVNAEAVSQTAPPRSQVDVEQILRQFADFSRVNISQDTTSIDMQLNPEHLGKLYLHIAATKEGSVTAQITTTNELVREALETQLAELKVTLNQQGVKVDEVEVTVASHEFEQNLEQNAAQEQRQGEQQERQAATRTRSLLRGELDDLAGLASEEEVLAARIMRDNGNSMDVTV
ncbi:MAG: flagellar hook-length control protein FliK [Lachnospiraceae bacterium]|nr:flagellar hook-length control protein FliK [Lachnospiraceae bacterium]